MNSKYMTITAILASVFLITGCARNAADESKNNGTYSTSMHLLLQPDFPDRSFSSSRDFSLSTEFNDVTFIWPEGKGNFSKESGEISFEGNNIKCSVIGRRLAINGRSIAEFEEGDRVRITGDGRVFVNGVEIEPSGDN